MTTPIKINRVKNVFSHETDPLGREAAASRLDDVALLFADGRSNPGELIARPNREAFDSVDDRCLEHNHVMPIEAVGEPGQSDGDV